jgi:hypothetical protein
MTLTYNPILDRTEVARRWIKSSIAAPEFGTALVLVRSTAEPIVVWHGQPVPTVRLGEHRRYVIDVANHRLRFRMNVASKAAVFPFAVTIELGCRVLDPLTIARDNIQDMTAALMPSLGREVRDMAARFDIMQPTEAARAIEDRLSSAHQSPVVWLDGYSVMVVPLNTQGVVAAKQELSVQELRRKEMKEVSGSLEERLAQLLATNNGDVREVLEYLASERNTEAEIKLRALEIALGGKMEDMDVADVHRNAFGNLFGGNGNGSGSKKESMRDRVERRNKAALENGRVVEGSVPAPATAEKSEGGTAEKPEAGAAPPEGT